MTVAMVNVKLNKRLICDGKFRMQGYEGQMDANRAKYFAALGEVEILEDGPATGPAAEELGLSDEPAEAVPAEPVPTEDAAEPSEGDSGL